MSEPIRENIPEKPAVNEAAVEKMPMAWHGFSVKCLLPLAAAVQALHAVWIFLGKIYYTGAVRDTVYAGLPAMRILDYALAAMLLLAAVLLLLARGRLAKMQKPGIKQLLAGWSLLGGAWIGYGVLRHLLAGLSQLSIPVVGRAAGYLVLMLIYRTYYARRSSLFKSEG